MRRFLPTTLFTLFFLSSALAPPASAARFSVSVSVFHSELDPYGSWVDVPPWGLVWRPDGVGAGWQPYLVGSWVYSDYGWTWISEDPWEPWPHHYGTWVLSARYGWVWVPGTVWAPAWVTWYVTDRYVGWAPVAPSLSVSLSGVTHARYAAPAETVVFVPTRAFATGEIRRARIDRARSRSLLRTAKTLPSFAVVDGVVRTMGPVPERIEMRAGVSVRRAGVSAAHTRPARLSDDVLRQRRATAVVAPRAERELARGTRRTVQTTRDAREVRTSKPRVLDRPDRTRDRKIQRAPRTREVRRPEASGPGIRKPPAPKTSTHKPVRQKPVEKDRDRKGMKERPGSGRG